MASASGKVFKEFYKVIENFGYAAIVYDRATGRLEYLVIEPELTEEEREALERIKRYIVETSEPDLSILNDREAMEEYIKERFEEILKKYKVRVKPESKDKLIYYLIRDLLGYGELEVMMRDPNIEDISCDGVGLPVYVWHRRYESLPSNVVYRTSEDLMRTLNRLAYKAGKQISVAFPIVEGALPEGYRIHLTLSEVSRRGGTFTIRKFREEPFTVIDLIKFKTLSPLLAAYLWLLVDLKRSIMILGVTGSGKTTTLNAVAMLIRPEAKIVTIEDTPEINLPHENWIPLVTRPSHERWRMDVTLYELLRTALRQRPDYIIVGEIRGEEAYTLFQAIASVSRDTPVLLYSPSEGRVVLRAIGDFADEAYSDGGSDEPRAVSGDWRVLTLDGGEVAFRPVRYVLRHRASELYEVKHSGGGAILATGSHSVFVLGDDFGVVEKRVDELEVGDLLVTFCAPVLSSPRRLAVIDLVDLLRDCDGVEVTLDGKRLSVREYLTSEADPKRRVRARVRLGREELPALLEVDEGLAALLGCYLARGKVEGSMIVLSGLPSAALAKVSELLRRLGVRHAQASGGLVVESRLLAEALRRLASHGVPEQLWMAERGVVESFIDSVLHARGGLSEELRAQVVWLARLHGVPLRLDGDGFAREGGDLVLAEPVRRLLVEVAAAGRVAEASKALKLLGSDELVERERAVAALRVAEELLGPSEAGLASRLRALIEGGVSFYRVTEVRRVPYEGYVYDVSVPGSEAFFGGDVPVLLHNTGHAGLSTMHAENVHYAIRRLETRPMNVPRELIPMMNVFVEIARIERQGRIFRRIVGVYETLGLDPETGDVKLHQVFKWDPVLDRVEFTGKSYLLERVSEMGIYIVGDVMEELRAREAILRRLAELDVRSFKDVARVIRDYYYRPESVKRRFMVGVS